MKIRVLYFARLREYLGTAEEEIELPPEGLDVAGLLGRLRARGGNWANELSGQRPLMVAVNQDMAHARHALRAGDEVALFPPVTGG